MAKQGLIHHYAQCNTCGDTVDARNALAWSHNHIRYNPGHEVELQLGYLVE